MQTMPNTTDIFIVQGTDYSTIFNVTNVEDYAFYGCIRKNQDDVAFLEFSAEIDTEGNTVTFSLDSTQTSSLYPKTYLYQISAKSMLDNTVSALAHGNAIVDPSVPFVDPGLSVDGEIIIDGGTF